MIIWYNGKITTNATIPVSSEAFLFGQAVFETIRTYSKQPYRLEDHLERLYLSADIMDIVPTWYFEKTLKTVQKAIAKSPYKKSRIRAILTVSDLIVMIERLKEKPASYYQKGVRLVTYTGRRTLPEAKKLGDAMLFAANQYAKKQGAYDSLLVDENGWITECSYANVFWVKNGKVHTPRDGVLPGITRDTVLTLSGGTAKNIKLRDLLKVDEIFITQTTAGILPVVKIENHTIGNGKVGEVTKTLMKYFSEVIQSH